MGHLSRASALAVALGSKGVTSTCLANGESAPLTRDGVRWEPLPEPDSPPDPSGSDVIVLDSYRIRLAGIDGRPLVVLQEHTAPPPGASLVVNAGADPARGDLRLLYGFAYACLRSAFWGVPGREVRENVGRVLVTTGAGDPGGLGAFLAGAARDAIPEARVTLVRGPYAAVAAVEGVDVVEAPDSLLPLLLEHDLVITAAGQTMLEAAATGVPCVAVPLVENQEQQAARLAALGAVRTASPEQAVAAAADLASHSDSRRQLAARAQATVDGYGALRVAFAIARLSRPN